MRSGAADNLLAVLDSCRIRWGVIRHRAGDDLLVDVVPLELRNGKLRLGQPRPETVAAWRDGTSFLDGAAPGDAISVHWNWACDKLDARRLGQLQGWTAHELAMANQTL